MPLSSLAIEAVIREMSALQVDKCQKSNFVMNRIITTYRHNLSLHKVKRLSFWIEDGSVWIAQCVLEKKLSKRLTIERIENVMQYISHIKPEFVCFECSELPPIKKIWFKGIRELSFDGATNREQVEKILSWTSCTTLFMYPKFEMSMDDVLAHMPYVEGSFGYGHTVGEAFSPQSFDTLAAKSHVGKGLEFVRIINKEVPMSSQDLIRFIETAKFILKEYFMIGQMSCNLVVSRVNATWDDFHDDLRIAFARHEGWRVCSGLKGMFLFMHGSCLRVQINRYTDRVYRRED